MPILLYSRSNVSRMADPSRHRRVAELYDLYASEDVYYTPPTAPMPREDLHSFSTRAYQPRTLKSSNRIRQSILPCFPSRSQATDGNVDLLLCNVPSESSFRR